jgi:hypothetical protein
MATPVLTVHQAAQIKQEVRRGNSGNTKWTGKYLQQLKKVGERLLNGYELKDSDYNTLAIGLIPRAEAVIVCSKGFEPVSSNEAALLIVKSEIPGVNNLVTLVNPEPKDATALSHLHAEMAIIQYVVKELGCAKDKLSEWGVEIACIRKGVCPDCSGWLNQHAVPHSDIRKTVATTGWSSPLNGAFYKYKGSELQYNKGKLNTVDTKDLKYTGKSKVVQSSLG